MTHHHYVNPLAQECYGPAIVSSQALDLDNMGSLLDKDWAGTAVDDECRSTHG